MTNSNSAGTLDFGIQLPIQSQSTIYSEPWESTAGISELAAVARAADRNKFLYVALAIYKRYIHFVFTLHNLILI